MESHLARNASLGEWWNSDGNTKVSAKDQLALCNALLWSYIDDEDMIGDPVVLNRLVFLHFTICSLVQEITFPQWYTEEEFTELEADFTFVAVECNWLQSLLQCHSELPGVGFNIIKFHDFLSIPSIMRELGCIMSADTSTMEMRMKDLKMHDKFVKKTRRDKGHHKVFLRAVAQDLDDAYQAWKDSCTSGVGYTSTHGSEVIASEANAEENEIQFSESDTESEDEYTFADTTVGESRTSRKVGAWKEIRYVLERGINGPALDTSEVFDSFPEGIDLMEGVTKFYVRELITHEDPTTRRTCSMFLLPGHCVQLQDGRYAQVVVPNADVSDAYGFSGPVAVLSIFKYVNVEVHRGNHPVIPVPFLERAVTQYVPVSSVIRRVHMYPRWRSGPRNTASVAFNTQFLLNPFVFKVRRGPAHPLVCVSCPNGQCTERVLKPVPPEKYAVCPSCDHRFIWF